MKQATVFLVVTIVGCGNGAMSTVNPASVDGSLPNDAGQTMNDAAWPVDAGQPIPDAGQVADAGPPTDATVPSDGGPGTNPDLTLPRGGITVTITPSPAWVSVSDHGFFTATVSGSSDTAVTWSVKEAGGGTINVNGVYAAPSSEGVWHVIATSHADPTISTEATVNVTVNLVDHGGPVWPTVHAYAVLWGDPANLPVGFGPAVVSFLSGLDGTGYLALADQYLRGGHAHVTYMGTLTDSSPPPANPGQQVYVDLCNRLVAGGFHPDAQTVLFLYPTTTDVLGSQFCGEHSSVTCDGIQVPYAIIDNARSGFGRCAMPSRAWLSCNTHSLDTEGMLNVSAHELMETITDPFSSAWKGTYNEMADGCEWHFQSCVTLSTGPFQLQEEWSNAAHACVQD